MTSTLQRSSVSFRRQGSSGRIWGEPQEWELKGHSGLLSASSLSRTLPPPPPPQHLQESYTNCDDASAQQEHERAAAAPRAEGDSEKKAAHGCNFFRGCLRASSPS